jgi:hypothetical protein
MGLLLRETVAADPAKVRAVESVHQRTTKRTGLLVRTAINTPS